MAIRVTPLGAGKHVGRSCILLELAGCRILIDCGVHNGSRDAHYPELHALIADGRTITEVIDVVVISHFHLDHIGALPYLTEVLGYRGPVLMTHPTRAIAPVLLQDHLFVSARGVLKGLARFTAADVAPCFARATCMQLQERIVVKGLAITPYYAGHVLGAAMLLLEFRGRSALYTGDFTTVPDHHLGAARVPLGLQPDVMITETTCCTTIRSSKRAREQELCRKIQDALEKGGKVLVPVFMIGRAQEFCLLCEKHWERTKMHYPIYIVRGMAEKALTFFRLFASWSTNQLRMADEPFKFAYAKMCYVSEIVESNTPMVVFAGPSMLTGGPSLELFRKWAPDEKNLIVFPGYCIPGTIGNEVQAKVKRIHIDAGVTVDVCCGIEYMSHSDHTDSRGITQLIKHVAPKHVVLVHGAEKLMQVFRPLVEQRLRVACSDPAVGERLDLGGGEPAREVLASPLLVLRARPVPGPPVLQGPPEWRSPCCPPAADFSGLLVRRKRGAQEAFELVERHAVVGGLRVHRLQYRHELHSIDVVAFNKAWQTLQQDLQARGASYRWTPAPPPLEGELAAGVEHTLTALASLRCRLGPGQATGVARLIVEWTREDEHQTAAVSCFLESLGAG